MLLFLPALVPGVSVLTFHLRSLLRGDMFPPLSQIAVPASPSLVSNSCPSLFAGMNAAVRAVVRMGIYVGAKVYFIYEVSVTPSCFL